MKKLFFLLYIVQHIVPLGAMVEEIPWAEGSLLYCTFDDGGKNLCIQGIARLQVVSLDNRMVKHVAQPTLWGPSIYLPTSSEAPAFCRIEKIDNCDRAVIDFADDRESQTLDAEDIIRIAVSPKGRFLALANKHGKLFLYQGPDYRLRSSSSRSGGAVFEMDFTCDERFLVCNTLYTADSHGVGQQHSRIRIFDLSEGLGAAVSVVDRTRSAIRCSPTDPKTFTRADSNEITRHSIGDPKVEETVYRCSKGSIDNTAYFSEKGDFFVGKYGPSQEDFGVLQISPNGGVKEYSNFRLFSYGTSRKLINWEKGHLIDVESGNKYSTGENRFCAYNSSRRLVVLITPDKKKLLVKKLEDLEASLKL